MSYEEEDRCMLYAESVSKPKRDKRETRERQERDSACAIC
jgi:hypothetical protein